MQSPTPEVIYWVGCAASYKKQQIARAMVKILNAAKVPYRILGSEEWCTGAPLARMGYEDVTKKELMPHNVQAVEETGAKVLVTACAECYRAFARDYKQWGGNPPFSVFHISHYVEKLIREKRIAFTKPLPQKVAFHDACHMSRVTKVYEAPRQALKFIKDLKVLEILPHHQDALCSGAGGGFPRRRESPSDVSMPPRTRAPRPSSRRARTRSCISRTSRRNGTWPSASSTWPRCSRMPYEAAGPT